MEPRTEAAEYLNQLADLRVASGKFPKVRHGDAASSRVTSSESPAGNVTFT